MSMNRLVPAIATMALASFASAQLSVTIPAGLAAVEGNSSNAFPWNRFSSTQNLQQQMFYDSTHFTSQGIVGPIVITKLTWRANATTASWAGGTQTGCWIDLSTAAFDQAAVTTNMVSNHGADYARVYSGNVAVLPGTGNGTGVPGPVLVDQPITPFIYDPSLGDLCIDTFVPSLSWAAAAGTSLDVQTTGSLSSRVFNSTNAAAGTVTQNHGTVVTLEYVPASGLYPAFSANVQSGVSPLAVNFTDATYSSAAGGVQSWSWDFNGDNVIDSNLQNPTFVYSSCGTYTVSLTVTDNQFGAATETKVGFIVVDAIAPNFTASSSGGFAPANISFTDTSTGPVAAYLWDLDGDSVIDSNLQNPSFLYATPGTYSVSLTVINGCNNLTVTKTNLITILAPGSLPAPAELMQFQLNEVRGNTVANTASTGAAPAQGTVNNSTWQSDPNRPLFKGNEAGFGCLGYRTTGAASINTGWTTSITGSMSISFWLRKDPAAAASPFGYAFGNGTFRSFVGGAAGAGITFRGTALTVDSGFTVNGTPGVWQHLTVVVDDAAGTARWYDNGTPSGTVVNFTPNTFSYTSTLPLAIGAISTAGGSPIGTGYDLDDFRFYTRALTGAEVLVNALSAEAASAGAAGTFCDGPGGTPIISGNGVPSLGNASFSVDLSNAENSKLAAIVFGFLPATFGTFDLSPWLGAGCELQLDYSAANFHITAGNAASQAFAIPSAASFQGLHIYSQWVILGTTGAASRLLDINLQ